LTAATFAMIKTRNAEEAADEPSCCHPEQARDLLFRKFQGKSRFPGQTPPFGMTEAIFLQPVELSCRKQRELN
jgi:hypothetical protein